MNTLSVIALFVLFIYIAVGIYALFIDISNKMNRLFFLECLSLAIWSLTAVIIYSSVSRSEVILWYKISSFGFGLYYALILHLYLLFTKTNLSKIKIAAIYVPSLIVILSTWFSYTLFEDFILTSGKWQFVPAFSHAGFYVYAVYYISYIVTTIIFLILWQKRSRSKKEKLQSRIISLSYLFTAVLCTTTDFILPGLPWYKLPALAPILLVINTGAIFYVLQKYRFLSPAVDIFSDDLLYFNKDIAMLIDGTNRVIKANRTYYDFFLCTKDVAGALIDDLFIIDNLLLKNLIQMTSGKMESCSGILNYKNGKGNDSFLAECVRVTDRFGDFLGNLISINELNNEIITDENSDLKIPSFDKIKTEREWGIDLTGRRMWHEPWPEELNDNQRSGEYRAPLKNEIDTTFSISGEAVNETLLYFEECGGNTSLLVSMLNDHMINESFTANRSNLLDKKRCYSHEFYFYFIMFTKKVIGRYDFHFGEKSDEQLSIHHKIYEQGLMEYIPYGKTKIGTEMHDVTTSNELGLLIYLENVLHIDTSDIIKFINRNLNQKYNIDRSFYNNETIWCSLEFIEYGFEFSKIIGNNSSFFENAAIYSSFNGLRIGKLVFLIPAELALSQIEVGISKVNNIHDIKFVKNRGFARFLISIKPDFDIKKYSKYLKASVKNDSAIYNGAMAAVLKMIYGLKEIPESVLIINDNTNRISFSIEYRWSASSYDIILKIAGVIIISILAGFGSYYLGFYFYTLFLTLTVSLMLYFFEQKKELSDKHEEHQMASNQQLEALEETSAELLEERNTLENKVNERTKELELANIKLSELDRVKSNFFANISHEIRTPLTLILTPIESLLYKETGRIPEREFFESIYSNGLNLLGLINNLLDFSKLDAGHSKLDLCEIDMIRLMHNHADAVRSMTGVKGIELLLEYDSDDILLIADPDKINKIISNLMSNAIKFTGTGGRITVRIYKVYDNNIEFCVIGISDTGIGIPEHHLENIFDRFSQVDSNSSRRYEGTGIGLALVKEYVNLHDGTIDVESRHIDLHHDFHGSLFTIKIPNRKELLSKCDDEGRPRPMHRDMQAYSRQFIELPDTTANRSKYNRILSEIEPDETTAEKTATILVVEDNADMHTLLSDILSSRYKIIRAYNGREALELLEFEENIPDLILSDVMMPEMDGQEFTLRIRNDLRFEGIPVVLLTARSGMNMKLEGFDTGAADYIIKPFNSMELEARIRSQLELKALRDRLLHSNKLLYAKLENISPALKPVSHSSEEKIKRVITFINENYTSEISREGIASAVDMNPDNLSRIFNKITGKRIDTYINELRINRTKQELAETEKQIITIAMDAGFENLRTFNRLFRETEGMTPKEYREKIKSMLTD